MEIKIRWMLAGSFFLHLIFLFILVLANISRQPIKLSHTPLTAVQINIINGGKGKDGARAVTSKAPRVKRTEKKKVAKKSPERKIPAKKVERITRKTSSGGKIKVISPSKSLVSEKKYLKIKKIIREKDKKIAQQKKVVKTQVIQKLTKGKAEKTPKKATLTGNKITQKVSPGVRSTGKVVSKNKRQHEEGAKEDANPSGTEGARIAHNKVFPEGFSGGPEIDVPDFNYNYYLGIIRNKIDSRWDQPVAYREIKQTLIEFIIRRNGEIDNIRIRESSGDYYFDQTALRAVTLSNPFPPLPRGYKDDFLKVRYRFIFGGKG